MAGGSGERFWPVSRRCHPKQLLYLTSETETMLEEAVNRLTPLIPKEQIFIATSVHLRDLIRRAFPDHPMDNILGEPLPRNTSGCLAFAVANILARFDGKAENLLMSVTTADHLIGDGDRFRDTISAALQFAKEEDALVTIGTHPTRPETGYGYIQIDQLNQPLSDFKGVPIYQVARFLEKPNHEDAERYQASRFYYWNSGMFFWRISTFIDSLKTVMPPLAESIDRMADILKRSDESDPRITEIFKTIPNTSIDYGLMEKADNVYVALGDFKWDDVGSWDSLSRFRARDQHRNITVGEPVLIDCNNVIAYNEPGRENMAVCVIGMENIIVVTSNDGVLVCPKSHAQDVRKAVDELKNRNAKQI
jgi:mannose-1-phosphate guanylyltransferase